MDEFTAIMESFRKVAVDCNLELLYVNGHRQTYKRVSKRRRAGNVNVEFSRSIRSPSLMCVRYAVYSSYEGELHVGIEDPSMFKDIRKMVKTIKVQLKAWQKHGIDI